MDIICTPVLGIVDNNWGVEPFYNKLPVLKSRLVLTSIPVLFFRLPVLRRVVRLGLFINPIEDGTTITSPRIIVQSSSDTRATTIRFRRFKYTCSVNVMDGELAMIQPENLRIHDDFGVFLGIMEWQFKMPRPTKLSVAITIQASWETGGHGVFEFIVE